MPSQEVRVLFVDDDPFFADLGKETLAEHGFAVTVASDGQEALAKIAVERFDLAILDNEMPGLSGFEVIEQIRELAHGADLPIIMATGSDDEQSINRAFEVGADSFLAKPFDWSLLVHQANFVLKSARATKDLREAMHSQELFRSMQDRFVQTLVCEAQKPLKTALNFARIMNSEPDGPLGSDYYRSCVDEIFQAMDRVNTTFVKLIHRSDLGAQVAELDESSCSLQELVSELVDWARREAHGRNIDIVTHSVVPANVSLRCDRILLMHAIKNLLQSALNVTPRGTAVELSVACDLKSGLHIAIDDKAPVNGSAAIGVADGEPSVFPLPIPLQTSNVVVKAHGGQLRQTHLQDGGRVEVLLGADRLREVRESKCEPDQNVATGMVGPVKRAIAG